MIERIVAEIRTCIEKECYLAALTMALTLPDICGKAEYPDHEDKKDKTRKRYVQWFDTYIGQYYKKYGISKKEGVPDLPYPSGELVYQLRNSVLHSGMVDINAKRIKEERNKVTKFQLVIPNKKKWYDVGSGAVITRSPWGEELSREYSISIPFLCEILCNIAEEYYNANKRKFDFFQYNIVDKRRGDSKYAE